MSVSSTVKHSNSKTDVTKKIRVAAHNICNQFICNICIMIAQIWNQTWLMSITRDACSY